MPCTALCPDTDVEEEPVRGLRMPWPPRLAPARPAGRRPQSGSPRAVVTGRSAPRLCRTAEDAEAFGAGARLRDWRCGQRGPREAASARGRRLPKLTVGVHVWVLSCPLARDEISPTGTPRYHALTHHALTHARAHTRAHTVRKHPKLPFVKAFRSMQHSRTLSPFAAHAKAARLPRPPGAQPPASARSRPDPRQQRKPAWAPLARAPACSPAAHTPCTPSLWARRPASLWGTGNCRGLPGTGGRRAPTGSCSGMPPSLPAKLGRSPHPTT